MEILQKSKFVINETDLIYGYEVYSGSGGGTGGGGNTSAPSQTPGCGGSYY